MIKTTVLKHVSSKLDEIDDKTDLLADSVKRKNINLQRIN